MKIIKILSFAILAIVGFLVIAGFFVQNKMLVVRSVHIDAPLEVVHQHLKSHRSMSDWLPWRIYDPELNLILEGMDGEVGSRFIWEGNSDVGKGYQELVAVKPDRIDSKVTFVEPWESTANTYFTLEESDSGTIVNWAFETQAPYPFNALMLFYDMEGAVGEDFSRGLDMLKEKVLKEKVGL
jgi:hypothetical protein